MKYMRKEHFRKLDEIKLNRYFQECVESLEKIAYLKGFPDDEPNYLNFVKHTYSIAQEYGLTNQKYAFGLMLLWHVEGDSLTKDEEFLEVLQNEGLEAHNKYSYFKQRALEKMRKENSYD